MIALPLALVLLTAAVVLLQRAAAPLGPADGATLARVAVPDTPAARELLGRWRDRARRWRSAAAFPAVVVAIIGSLRLRGRLDLGLVDTVGAAPLWTDPVVAGLLAIALGGFAAELHHLRRPRGPRTAELRPRDVSAFRRRGSRVRRWALVAGLGASAAAHVVWVLPGRASGSFGALGVAATVLGLAELVERRITLRPRPALPAELAAADDVVRRAAVRSVDDSASGAVLLLVAWASLGVADVAPAGTVVDLLHVAVSLTVLGLSLWWAWRSVPQRLLPGSGRGVQP